MKNVLTKNEYYQALGLFSLAQNHINKCEEFNKALTELLEADELDHHSDAIYNNESLDDALKRMKITIED